MAAKLHALKGLKEANPRKVHKSRMDTMIVTPEGLSKWKLPSFQRPLKVNNKVLEIAEEMKHNGGVISGTITLGIHRNDWYIVDGQHRLKAFEISELPEGICDVRIVEFDDMADMAEEFAKLNDHIVRMNPDDKLRALAQSSEGLQLLAKRCPYVGYASIRRGDKAPIVSMSMLLRAWFSSAAEAPANSHPPSVELGRALSCEEAERLTEFLTLVYGCWGRDREYDRLWLALNLTLVMWLWRRTVLGPKKDAGRLTKDQFAKACMALSADSAYLDYLVGRRVTDRDRSPCFGRIKSIFSRRLAQDGITVRLPAPPWASH